MWETAPPALSRGLDDRPPALSKGLDDRPPPLSQGLDPALVSKSVVLLSYLPSVVSLLKQFHLCVSET